MIWGWSAAEAHVGMVFGIIVAGHHGLMGGRRPWLWTIMALPAPAIALVVRIPPPAAVFLVMTVSGKSMPYGMG